MLLPPKCDNCDERMTYSEEDDKTVTFYCFKCSKELKMGKIGIGRP